MKIYISGQITGLDLSEAEKNFADIEAKLKASGYEVVNPMTLVPYQQHLTWKDYMAEYIKALWHCDAIIMLDNWTASKGAKIEHGIAVGLGLPIYHAKNHNLF